MASKRQAMKSVFATWQKVYMYPWHRHSSQKIIYRWK